MATVISRAPLLPRTRARAEALLGARSGFALAFGGLLLLSAFLRTRQIGAGLWIDEGLSIGISSRDLTDIPGVLRMDGSPPLYYLLLHGWMQLFGAGEEATHALSLVLALLAVPVAMWAGWSLFGRRAGWIGAAFAALDPFLTNYAQETRMYALVALLGIVTIAAYLHVMAFDRTDSGHVALLAVSLAALLYTHNWALFLGAAMGAGWVALLVLESARRPTLGRAGLFAFGGAALLYAPWVPTLLYQMAHTGAPWSRAPALQSAIDTPARLLGGEAPEMVMLLCGGAGAWALLAAGRAPAGARGHVAERAGHAPIQELRALGLLIGLFALPVLLAWGSSQISPAWATRYLAIALPALLLLGTLGFAANRTRTALVGLVLLGVLWVSHDSPAVKSNVREVMGDVSHLVAPGDLVVVTQPELVPVVNHYLPPGLQYATLTGRVKDVGVTDWVDGVDRLRATDVKTELEPLLDALPEGRNVLLVQPLTLDSHRWQAPWTSLVREKSLRWRSAITGDDRFTVTALSPGTLYPVAPNPVRATLFSKSGVR